MNGNEIEATFFEGRAWVVGLQPFPRLYHGTEHDNHAVPVLAWSPWSSTASSVLPRKSPSTVRPENRKAKMSSGARVVGGNAMTIVGASCD